jgi:succinoglycan biosynthesis transport protein ExoP
MAFDNKVDYMPNRPSCILATEISDAKHKLIKKCKWQVLISIFVLVLICANALIWSQSAVYQSQSILHFSYKSNTNQGFAELAQQQITRHQQRLISNKLLTLASRQLEQSQGLMINVQTLFQVLTVQTSFADRIISLRANGNEPQVLRSILDAL